MLTFEYEIILPTASLSMSNDRIASITVYLNDGTSPKYSVFVVIEAKKRMLKGTVSKWKRNERNGKPTIFLF
jgi:hypothetical protein